MAQQPDKVLSEFACDNIEKLNLKRDRMPTREEVRNLLDKEEDSLFFLNINFTTPEPKCPTKNPKYDRIISMLWEKYRLYKLRSTEGKKYSLNRSMYLGLIKDGDLTKKKRKINDLIDEAKREILNKGVELNVAKVHVIATLAIIYDVGEEEEEPTGEEEKGMKENADIKEEEEEEEESNKETMDTGSQTDEVEASDEESLSKRPKKDEDQEDAIKLNN
ncbi:PREDICTED: glutamic acid-rich protein-like [Amphimedon queenslandica]|uniref:Uncharacterized protein n=1 Tax=Amphimedon queenslandica TaxID=400682 RepID=A0A1X7VJX9_AMPQE|nr:PREDICTED: glutamic acid-rich protein-like [Amphimedon queenslandica]|eukprot:XP_019848749.1 PREDICTED: glutamic acid-rich protein-like [Amphimedon queenslandica]